MASDAEAAGGAGGGGSGGGGSGAGRLVAGRYRLRKRLGHGGMGAVWLADDEVGGRQVAVKEPRTPSSLSERERATVHARMRREALAAARIHHPSVVAIHEVVVEDGQPWIVMELVRGRSLADVLATDGPVPPHRAAAIGLRVLGALAAAHAAGVLHRDVKPGNVLLGDDGRVVLSDFGLALVEGERPITEAGAILGSPEYLAPERALWRTPGPESDLWSLGVLLFEAVEGWSPFRRRTTLATLQAVVSDFPQIPRSAGPLIPLIMRLLNKEPADRPDGAQIEWELRAVAGTGRVGDASGNTVSAAPGRKGSSGAGGRRLGLGRRAVLALGAAVAVAALALAVALLRRG